MEALGEPALGGAVGGFAWAATQESWVKPQHVQWQRDKGTQDQHVGAEITSASMAGNRGLWQILLEITIDGKRSDCCVKGPGVPGPHVAVFI